LDAAHYI